MRIQSIVRKNCSTQNSIDISIIKDFLKIDHDLEDNIVIALAESAIETCEQYTEFAILNAIFEVKYVDVDKDYVVLPIRNANEVLKVTCKSQEAEKDEILKPKYYRMLDNVLYFSHITTIQQLSVEYNAGIANRFENVSRAIQSLIIQHIAFLYENRDGNLNFDMKKYDILKKSQNLICYI